MSDTPSTFLQTAAGRHLGPYRLLLQIGRGGMADVYLALAPSIGGKPRRQVVIKQLRRDIVEDDEYRAMFLDEGRLARRLDHANVVSTYALEHVGNEWFLVMEFLDGQPLSRIRQRAKSRGGVPLGVHLRVLADVLGGVHYLHELRDDDRRSLRVVHRDVTPQNVFVTYDGQVKVVDFGIAKAASRLAETGIGVLKGKLSYMSPESVRGKEVDRRSDVFSIGVMLWEAAVGARFWNGLDELTVYRRLVAGDLPVGGPLDNRMNPRLRRVVLKAVSARPEDRFATAAEMQAELERHLVSLAEGGARRLLCEHINTSFADDRETFHEQVHAELVKLDAGREAKVMPGLRAPPPPRREPLAVSPFSTTGSSTSRTDMTFGQELAAASARQPPAKGWGVLAAFAAVAVGLVSTGGVLVREQLQARKAGPVVLVSHAVSHGRYDDHAASSALPTAVDAPVSPLAEPAPQTSDSRDAVHPHRDSVGVPFNVAIKAPVGGHSVSATRPGSTRTASLGGPANLVAAQVTVKRATTGLPADTDLPRAVRERRALDREDPWQP